jgi:CRP-like cAMP-binding protein
MGNRDDLDTDVAAHPFLLGLNEHHVRLLADCAVRVAFERDHVVFREGETANRFYLIERGEIVLESTNAGGETITIDTIGMVICWAGRGFSPRISGAPSLARRRRQQPSFSTARFCVNIARKTTHPDTNSSSG